MVNFSTYRFIFNKKKILQIKSFNDLCRYLIKETEIKRPIN